MATLSIKPGVSIAGVQPEMAVGLVVIASVFEHYGVNCVITSCTDGKHKSDSLHYLGHAVDLRLPSVVTGDTSLDSPVVEMLRVSLGQEWDVVLETDPGHIHVEWDPKYLPKVQLG